MRTLCLSPLQRDVSRIGRGSHPFSPAGREYSFALLDEYVRLGGNLIDTAESYGEGDSERVIGEWLRARGKRGEVVLMDKGCRGEGSLTPRGMREAIEGSLERLGTSYLDVWVVHRDHPYVPVETVIDSLSAEVASGRIRAFGASNWPVSRLAAANEYAGKNGLTGLALSSPHLSLAVPMEPLWSNCLHATEEDITWHTRSGLPIFAWSALGHGFFREESGPGNRSDERLVRCYHNPDNFERLSRARQLAAERGLTAAQIALAYVLNLAAPTVAVVGPQTAEETQSCVSAGEVELSRAELDWLSLRAGAR